MTYPIRCLVLFIAIGLTACASMDQQTDCSLSDAELRQVKETAFAFLPEEWPIVDKACESLTDEITVVAPGKCAIAGRTTSAEGCVKSNHEGFSIVFDRDTLEPEDVHFKTE